MFVAGEVSQTWNILGLERLFSARKSAFWRSTPIIEAVARRDRSIKPLVKPRFMGPMISMSYNIGNFVSVIS